MIVAHILKTTGLSGAEAHLLSLAQGLKAENFDSVFVVLHQPQKIPTALVAAAQRQNINLQLIPLAHDLDFTVIPKIKKTLKETQAQIVHTHMIHGDLFGTLAANHRTIVQSRHNDDPFRRNLVVKLLTRYLASRAKTVIAISDALAAFVRDVEGVPAAKITRIHYGLDPLPVQTQATQTSLRAELNLSPEIPLLGAVGRLTQQKGFEYLLQALAKIRQTIPAQLVIAGEGERRHALESLAQSLALSGAVYFLGWRTDIPAIINDLDLFIVPSLWEGFGLVTLEAMALSKPIVASRVSALPEIVIDGETGILVPAADAPALAAAIGQLLRDPERRSRLGQQGFTRLQKEFTIQRLARQHVAVYREAASRVPEFRA